jgi:hypothetical protein
LEFLVMKMVARVLRRLPTRTPTRWSWAALAGTVV